MKDEVGSYGYSERSADSHLPPTFKGGCGRQLIVNCRNRVEQVTGTSTSSSSRVVVLVFLLCSTLYLAFWLVLFHLAS